MRPLRGKFNGSQASRRSTSALACRRPIGMFLASVASRANCTSEPRRQRCARGSGTSRRNSKKPMRVPTRCRVIARPRGDWGVLRWHWPCAAMRPKRRSSPGRLRSCFQTEPSGMRCNYPRFALRSRSSAISPPKPWNCWHPPRLTSALTPRRCTCVAWLTCVCVRARRPRLSSEKILDHKGASWGSTWIHPNWGLYYSLSYLGLARASALAGDTAKAGKAYQDFFALWKDADPDIPILISKPKRNTRS